jgi:hypothetical protein
MGAGDHTWQVHDAVTFEVIREISMAVPPTNYASSHQADIAFRIQGRGERDIVFMMPFASHLDMLWDLPEYRNFVEELCSLGRLIAFDKRLFSMKRGDVMVTRASA